MFLPSKIRAAWTVVAAGLLMVLATPDLRAQCKAGSKQGGSSTRFGGPGNPAMTSMQLQQRLILMTSLQQQQRTLLMTSLQQQQRTPFLTPVQQQPPLQTMLQQQEQQNNFLIGVPQQNAAWVQAQQKYYVAALRTALQQTSALDRALQNQKDFPEQQAWRDALQEQKGELTSLQQQFVQK